MLNEQKADLSLETIMEMAEDQVLKAKTDEDKKEAYNTYVNLCKIYNERLRIQNEHCDSESKIAFEVEKMENDKTIQEITVIDEREAKRKERWIKIGSKALELSIVGLTVFMEAAIMHHNMIKTDDVSKANSRNVMNRLGDYLKG